MFYLVKTPWWLKRLYPRCLWTMPTGEKKLYLSFDDGPHPEQTPFVLETLKKYDARATFFCIGKNVEAYPELFRQIREEGHAVGNHTHQHLNGWKTADERYLENVARADVLVNSPLFRPPYGRATRRQLRLLTPPAGKYRPVMWTVLSGDFDTGISPQQCFENVCRHATDGAIIVFHDSEKAAERLRFALPRVLAHFSALGYQFEAISEKS